MLHLKQVSGQSAAASEERKRQHHWASRHALLWQRGGWKVGGESHLAAPCFKNAKNQQATIINRQHLQQLSG